MGTWPPEGGTTCPYPDLGIEGGEWVHTAQKRLSQYGDWLYICPLSKKFGASVYLSDRGCTLVRRFELSGCTVWEAYKARQYMLSRSREIKTIAIPGPPDWLQIVALLYHYKSTHGETTDEPHED